MDPKNAIAGSAFMRSNCGQLVIYSPDGDEIYRGKPDADLIQQHFEDEHQLVKVEIHNWLQREGVFGDGWHFIPMLSKKLAPNVKRVGSMRL